jgi:hypothetical protein
VSLPVRASAQTAKVATGPARQLDVSWHPPLRSGVQFPHHILERAGGPIRKLSVGCQAVADELLAVAEHEILQVLRLQRHDHGHRLTIPVPSNAR